MRHVYIEIRGVIPGALLELLRLEYGTRLIIRAQGLERMRDVLIAPRYEREPAKMRPGDFLRFYRCQGGLTQAALGKELGGIKPQNISGMEGGKRQIGPCMARKLANYFGVSTRRFLARGSAESTPGLSRPSRLPRSSQSPRG